MSNSQREPPHPDQALRRHLLELLRGGHAHLNLDDAVNGFPVDEVGVRPSGSPHSAWELLEHIRIAQHDIVRFSQSAGHKSPPWPKGYWPGSPTPESQEQWDESLAQIHKDMADFEAMLGDAARDLYAPFPWGDGQTLLREAMMLADHNAYHLGQLVLVRKLIER